jgi:hypothetical protein
MIEETELRLSDGFVFKVEMDPDEDMPCGCMISFERRDDEKLKALARAHGIDVESVNLVNPPKQVVSIYFNSAGIVDGDAGG